MTGRNERASSLHALTNHELDDYRRELEHSLNVLSERAPVRELLHKKLAEVLAEQEARSRLDQPSSDGPRRLAVNSLGPLSTAWVPHEG